MNHLKWDTLIFSKELKRLCKFLTGKAIFSTDDGAITIIGRGRFGNALKNLSSKISRRPKELSISCLSSPVVSMRDNLSLIKITEGSSRRMMTER